MKFLSHLHYQAVQKQFLRRIVLQLALLHSGKLLRFAQLAAPSDGDKSRHFCRLPLRTSSMNRLLKTREHILKALAVHHALDRKL